MIGILLSLVPLIAWGTGDYIASKTSKLVQTYTLGFFFSLIGWLVILPITLSYGIPEITMRQIALFLAGSLFVSFGFLSMLRGFINGPAGIVAPISNAYAILVAIFGVIFLNANLTLLNMFAISVVVAGIVLVSYSKPKKGEFKNQKTALAAAIVALLFFGIGFVLFGEAATGKWYENSLIFQTINVLVGAAILLVMQKKDKIIEFKNTARLKKNYLGGACSSLGALGLFGALETIDNVAIPAAIAAAAPLVTAFFAYAIDKEYLTHLQRFATVIIVSGIILLSV